MNKQKVRTYYNNRHSTAFSGGFFKAPIRKWTILKIEVSDDQITFHKKRGVYSYKWADFTEAFLRSKISGAGTAIPTGRDIRERILFLKTKDGQEHILDLSVGYHNAQDESEFSPDPKSLLKVLRIKLAPIFRYETNSLKVKWFTPQAAVMLGTAVFLGVAALLWQGDNLVTTVYAGLISTAPVWFAYHLNSRHWIVIADPEKQTKTRNS